MTYEQSQSVLLAMSMHGGGFIRKLGEAGLIADMINRRKIAMMFPDEWATYAALVESRGGPAMTRAEMLEEGASRR